MRRHILASIGSGLRAAAIVAVNCILLFAIVNVAVYFFVDLSKQRQYTADHFNQWVAKHGLEPLRRVYPGLSDDEIVKTVGQTGRFGQVFEPFIQVKSEPMILEHTALHRDGFRLIGKEQAPWPMPADGVNVFLFGGSTTAGSGVRDDHTFAALLQRSLRERYGRNDINIYNFGTGSHYSTQERIYFEQLLNKGITPDAVIFVDGLNDFWFWDDVPVHTVVLRHAFTYILQLSDPRGLGEAFQLVLQRLPVTNLIRRFQSTPTGKMPTAGLIGPAFASDNPLADRSKIDPVVHRYFRFQRMASGVARSFGVTPIVVWQPVPLYKYDPKLRLFPVEGDHGRHEFGYPVMAQAIAARDMGENFVSCADAFETAERPLYLDSVHYNVEGNERVAGCIAAAIIDRDLLRQPLGKGPASVEASAKP
jgi:GDSL-like lipase/acylhydrolase family protein